MFGNSIKKSQTHVCPHQISFFLDNWIRRLIQAPVKIVGPYIQEGNTVIDMGCGPGYFTIDMARMVGAGGRVIAVDIQVKMLERVRKKAQKHGLSERIVCHTADTDQIGLNQTADFILAYYMIHETTDTTKTLLELKTLLKDGGKILVVEPKMHVSRTAFENMNQIAASMGLKAVEFPKGKGGRCVVWTV